MENKNYDFVVCGAGISGMIAAVSAARRGLKVALLNDRSVLGGNASSEIGVVIQGACHHGTNSSVYAKETGLMDELRSKLDYAVAYCGYDTAAAADAVFFDFIYAEKNITLYLNTIVTGVSAENNRITEVIAYQMKEDRKISFSAPLYADCTGDAVVAYKAGAEIMMGSESKADFGEKSAGAARESYTMGNTLYFEIEDVGHPVRFVRPQFAYDVSKMDFMKHMNDPARMRFLYVGGRFWTLEYGGQVNTIEDNEHINLELRKLVFGLWDYIKNSGEYPEADNFKIKRVFSVAGTRESRRVVGDYILTENDIDDKTVFDDSVLTGGWPLDLHAPKGIYDDLPASAFIPVTCLYSIPYRCLYSKNIENLFLAGRNISATHIALSSTRVMGTCGAMGQVIGTAAALCVKYNIGAGRITKTHIRELKAALHGDDQHILAEKERGNANLESCFAVSASSEAEYENLGDEQEQPLDSSYGIGLPLKTKELHSFEIKIKNHSLQKQYLKVRVMEGSQCEAYIAESMVKELEVEIEAGFCGFQTIPVNCRSGKDMKLYIAFLKNDNLSLYGTKEPLPGAVTFRYYTEKSAGYTYNSCPLAENTGFIAHDILIRSFNLCFRNIEPKQHIFSAENLFNGYTRPYKHSNMWLSKEEEYSEIVLRADKPQKVKELHIFFDNELEDDRRSIVPPGMVKNYDVIISNGVQKRTIRIRNNFMRFNRIALHCEVKTIRLAFLSTYGRKRYAVYGIKLW